MSTEANPKQKLELALAREVVALIHSIPTDVSDERDEAETTATAINKALRLAGLIIASNESGDTGTRIEWCPECGAKLETFLRIDLDDVVVKNGEVVDFELAGSANDVWNGIVVEEARVTCVDCGHEVEAIVPMSITNYWTYGGRP